MQDQRPHGELEDQRTPFVPSASPQEGPPVISHLAETPPEGPPVISHHPTSSPEDLRGSLEEDVVIGVTGVEPRSPDEVICPDCGLPRNDTDLKHPHGAGGYRDPFGKEHTRALIEKEKDRLRHERSDLCDKPQCKDRCVGVPGYAADDLLYHWWNFDSIFRDNRSYYTMPDGTRIFAGDLNYYFVGMACAYRCWSWEKTLEMIETYKEKFQRIGKKAGLPMSGEVTDELKAAAKLGFDEERSRPDTKKRCSKWYNTPLELGEAFVKNVFLGPRMIFKGGEAIYNSIFGKK